MEEVISLLQEIENRFEVTVLYAVEAGSRAMGLDRSESDYDVRFIYCHNEKSKYLSLKEPKDTITGFSADRLYDWQGWDIKKSLALLRQSNPSVIEWLYSPIVYVCRLDVIDFRSECRSIVELHKQRVSLIHHYASMARKNFNSNIEKKESLYPKKYLYAIRGVLMMEWQFLQSMLPSQLAKTELVETGFLNVFSDLSMEIPDNIGSYIVELIEAKKNSSSKEIARIPELDDWILSKILPNSINERINEFVFDRHHSDVELYDNVFFKVFSTL